MVLPSSYSGKAKRRVALAPAPEYALRGHPHVEESALQSGRSDESTRGSRPFPNGAAGSTRAKLGEKVKNAIGKASKRKSSKTKVGIAKLPNGLQLVENSPTTFVKFGPVSSISVPSRERPRSGRQESPRLGASGNSNRSHVSSCTCGQCIKAKRIAKNAPIELRYKAGIRLIEATLENSNFIKTTKGDWNILWVSGALKPHVYQTLSRFQKVNQFPRTYEITRKDQLCRNMRRMQELHGHRHFDFYPKSFVLPADRSELQKEVIESTKRAVSAATDPDRQPEFWIVKPAASACGRGIYLTDNLGAIPLGGGGEDGNVLVSEYIMNPMLLDERKFDLRIYVAVTSFNPLRIYVYEEGLVRLTTEKYRNDPESLKNRYVHLTNYSVQKKSKNFVSNEAGTRRSGNNGLEVEEEREEEYEDDYDDEDEGQSNESDDRGAPSLGDVKHNLEEVTCSSKTQPVSKSMGNQAGDEPEVASKWSLETFRARLERMGIDHKSIFAKIDSLVIKTLISIEPQVFTAMNMHVRHANNCFQLFGFDVLIDQDLKPWLIEVNLGPSLGCDSALDLDIKSAMISDLLTLSGVQPCDVQRERGSEPMVTSKPTTNLAPNVERMVREMDAERRRSGRWRGVYPSPTSFIYDRFFSDKREQNQMIVDHYSSAMSHSDRLRIERRITSSARGPRKHETPEKHKGRNKKTPEKSIDRQTKLSKSTPSI